MGRPRKPTNLLRISGAFDKNPKRALARKNEPKPQLGIGPAPKEFLKKESPTAAAYLALWKETVKWFPEGTLTRMDRGAIYTIVLLRYKQERGYLKGGELSSLLSLYGNMGLTLASRSKVGEPAKPEADEFDAFVGQAKIG